MSHELLRVSGLRVAYPRADQADRGAWHDGVFAGQAKQELVYVVDAVDFSIAAGEALGLVGESGSGKSQTALAIMGLLPVSAQTSGSILLEGQELVGAPRQMLDRVRGSRIAMVFQNPMLSLHPALTIGGQLCEVLRQHRGCDSSAAHAHGIRMLDAVRIPDAARRMRQYPHELSGGMRQRVMIAMALLCEPAVLIADEPTTALDVTVQAQILALLDELRRGFGLGLLLITHDLALVSEHCERVAVVYAGRVVETGQASRLLDQPQHPYTRALLQCRPRLDLTRPDRLRSIPGQPPDAARRPPGCAFAPRCPDSTARCTLDAPTIQRVAGAGQYLPADGVRANDLRAAISSNPVDWTVVCHNAGSGRSEGL